MKFNQDNDMKHLLKVCLLFIPILLLFSACLTNNQAAINLDDAISNSAIYLQERFPQDTRAVVLAMQSDDPQVTDYAIRRIRTELVNYAHFLVVERDVAALGRITQEMNHQMSGYVDDDTSLSIGRQLGAEIIISVALVRSGQTWRLDTQALWLESAQLAGQLSVGNIRPEASWASLAAQRSPAQAIDNSIRDAVNSLAARLSNPMEISIGKLTLLETETPSELSRYLYTTINHHAVNNRQFRVVAPTRSMAAPAQGAASRGTISGTFNVEGDMVVVNLSLVSDSDNISIGSERVLIQAADLTGIPIAILPANVRTQEEARRNEVIFTPPVPQNNLSALRIDAWPNSSSFTYFNGEDLEINLISNRDCFFKVYHIDVEGKVQMIYPNARNRNNQIHANVMRTIPDPGIRYRIQAPFGQDSIIVVASGRQFENLEAEFAHIEQANQNNIGGILLGRGLGVELVEAVPQAETVNTRFHFTSLPSSSVLRN